LLAPKLGRLTHRRADGQEHTYQHNAQLTAQPGERVINLNPGGGGYGDPFLRPLERVAEDLRNGLVSLEGARLDYGVVFDAEQRLDHDATRALRARP
ncbi:hydantoinase B/oxoprolinase family protein, partial [Pseudomonas protegens]